MSATTPKGPQLAVLPTAAGDEPRSGAQVLQPSGWPTPKGYANGMAAEGRIVVTGGVIGWDAEERLADSECGGRARNQALKGAEPLIVALHVKFIANLCWRLNRLSAF